MTKLERIPEATNPLPVPTPQPGPDDVQLIKQRELEQFIAEVDALIDENLPALKELAK